MTFNSPRLVGALGVGGQYTIHVYDATEGAFCLFNQHPYIESTPGGLITLKKKKFSSNFESTFAAVSGDLHLNYSRFT